MKLATETITIYVPYMSEGEIEHERIVIRGASWHQTNKADITANGLKSADLVNVRIPVSAFPGQYVTAAAFIPSSSEFAFKEGMTVVRGETEEGYSDLIRDRGRDDLFTVLSFTDNLRGKAQHIKVVLS